MTYWSFWFNRNKMYHEDIKPNKTELISFIRAYIIENEMLNGLLIIKSVDKNIKWEPPNADTIKINFDACMNEGLVMGAFIYPCRHIAIPTTAEAWACLHAITFGEELGFREICFEEDSLMVIRGIEISKVADQILAQY